MNLLKFITLQPGFLYIEYDQELVDPSTINVGDWEEMKAKGFYGGRMYPKGTVDFKSLSDKELAELGLMRIEK